MAKEGKILGLIALSAAAVAAGAVAIAFYFSSSSINTLLTENRELSRAIGNLTDERQIGFVTVVGRETDPTGAVESVVRFVQTEPGNPDRIISEQLFPVEGDRIHLDALIVKFSDELVKDGKARALYIWRRIYGEQTAPGDGQPIEEPGEAPERYRAITESLKLRDREVFWDAIWDLANDPNYLSDYGVTAIYGNVIYTRMLPGEIYQLKISPTGQIYPDLLSYK